MSAHGFVPEALSLTVDKLELAWRAAADRQVDLQCGRGIPGSVLEWIGTQDCDDRISAAKRAFKVARSTVN